MPFRYCLQILQGGELQIHWRKVSLRVIQSRISSLTVDGMHNAYDGPTPSSARALSVATGRHSDMPPMTPVSGGMPISLGISTVPSPTSPPVPKFGTSEWYNHFTSGYSGPQ